MACRICNNDSNNKVYVGREMYFGFRDEFEYFQCAACGCLQIKDIPSDLSKYYSKEYNAYKIQERIQENFLVRFLKKKKLENSLGLNRNLIGILLNLFIKKGFIELLKPTEISIDSHILDVGTGYGSRLIRLRKKGFTQLTGIDPFIEKTIVYPNGIIIYKKYLSEASGQYDLIMLNHSFEHMPDPLQSLKDVNKLLKKGRTALIRIPVADSYGWRTYGVHWMPMDPPRHFYLHTKKSMAILAEKTGFIIKDIVYDMIPLHIAASEEFSKNIPLMSSESFYNNPDKSIFSRSEIKDFKKRVKWLNHEKDGDTACFYLVKNE